MSQEARLAIQAETLRMVAEAIDDVRHEFTQRMSAQVFADALAERLRTRAAGIAP